MPFGITRFAIVLTALVAVPWGASACTTEDFGRAVDEAGLALRNFNVESAPKLNAKIRDLKGRKGWSDGDEEAMAHDYLSDERLMSLDATANDLLTRIDALGRPPAGGTLDCGKLDELKTAGIELLAVMKAKAAYTTAKIDKELAASKTASNEAAPPPADQPTPAPALKAAAQDPAPAAAVTPAPAKPGTAEAPQTKTAALSPPAKPATPPPTPTPPPAPAVKDPAKEAAPAQGWSTRTDRTALDAGLQPPPPAQTPPPAPPPGAFIPPEEGYSIEEIQDVSRGFFGTISTGLASVIEHAFSQSGRPTAYVLGTEGGGAFLAGLRYGEGMLYLRSGGARPVYWHGPSLGYDFGAAGSRTLFLIYGMKDQSMLFRRFTGVDGSAYVIGGVGMTYLRGGDIVMAPIRSGLGLRLGANIGYVRFSSEPSWNPF